MVIYVLLHLTKREKNMVTKESLGTIVDEGDGISACITLSSMDERIPRFKLPLSISSKVSTLDASM
jgi:hypothetical protein